MTQMEPRPSASSEPAPAGDPLASRRCFWVFVAIFSVTVFAASLQMASKYSRYWENAQRAAPQQGAPDRSTHMARGAHYDRTVLPRRTPIDHARVQD